MEWFSLRSIAACVFALGICTACSAPPEEGVDVTHQAYGTSGSYGGAGLSPPAPTHCSAVIDCSGRETTTCDPTSGTFAFQSFGLWDWTTADQVAVTAAPPIFHDYSTYFRVCSVNIVGAVAQCTPALAPTYQASCPPPDYDPGSGGRRPGTTPM